MGAPVYVIGEDNLAKMPDILAECEFAVSVEPADSPLAVMYTCREKSNTEIRVRFASEPRRLHGKIVVILQPGAGWPWKLRTQGRMIDRVSEVLKSHGAVSLADAMNKEHDA